MQFHLLNRRDLVEKAYSQTISEETLSCQFFNGADQSERTGVWWDVTQFKRFQMCQTRKMVSALGVGMEGVL